MCVCVWIVLCEYDNAQISWMLVQSAISNKSDRWQIMHVLMNGRWDKTHTHTPTIAISKARTRLRVFVFVCMGHLTGTIVIGWDRSWNNSERDFNVRVTKLQTGATMTSLIWFEFRHETKSQEKEENKTGGGRWMGLLLLLLIKSSHCVEVNSIFRKNRS